MRSGVLCQEVGDNGCLSGVLRKQRGRLRPPALLCAACAHTLSSLTAAAGPGAGESAQRPWDSVSLSRIVTLCLPCGEMSVPPRTRLGVSMGSSPTSAGPGV